MAQCRNRGKVEREGRGEGSALGASAALRPAAVVLLVGCSQPGGGCEARGKQGVLWRSTRRTRGSGCCSSGVPGGRSWPRLVERGQLLQLKR